MHNMFKTTALFGTLSILAGCGGGSSSDSSAQPSVPNREVVAMDGLLKNAVVFEDANNNLAWDDNEKLFGLTNEYGKLAISANPSAQIGVMTVMAQSALAQKLAALDSQYADIETVDMDTPNSVMAKEVVFVAPVGVNVLSPFSHLVNAMATKEQLTIEQAKEKLETALSSGGYSVDALENYIEKGSQAERKLAQIMTDSISRYRDGVTSNWQGFIEESAQAVSQLDEEQLTDPSVRPNIDGDSSTPIQYNRSVIQNMAASKVFFQQWTELEDISQGDSGEFFRINLAAINVGDKTVAMMTDADSPDNKVTYSLQSQYSKPMAQSITLDNGLIVAIEEDGTTLTLSSTNVRSASYEPFILNALDKDANGEYVTSYVFFMGVETSTANKAPFVLPGAAENLQASVDTWSLQKGQMFTQTLNISELFGDIEGDALTVTSSGSALNVGLTTSSTNGILTISGIPVRSYQDDQTQHKLVLSAKDNFNFNPATIEITLPEILDGQLDTSNPLIGKSWYYIDSHEDDDGMYKNFCRYVSFKNGKVESTLANTYDYSDCQLASTQTTNAASYTEVNLTTVTERFFTLNKTYTVRYRQKSEQGEAIAVTLGQFAGDSNTETLMLYTDVNEVKRRLDIDSVNSNGEASFNFALPTENGVVPSVLKTSVTDEEVKVMLIPGESTELNCSQMHTLWFDKGISGISNTSWGFASCSDTTYGERTVPEFSMELNYSSPFSSGESYSIHFRASKGKGEFPYREALKLNFRKN